MKRIVPALAIAASLAAGTTDARAQTSAPPQCDQSFNQPAPGTGPEWQAGQPDPNFNGPAPGTGPEWQAGGYGPEWYSGVPCTTSKPQPAPQRRGLLGFLGLG
jgi:hypothetical protein